MLKRKITKDVYEGLSDVLKAEYKPEGDSYLLDVDDAAELTRALNTEKLAAKAARDEAKAHKTELDALKAANGDWTTLEASYKSKLAQKDEELATANTTVSGLRRDLHVGGVVDKIAAKFTVPSLVKDRIAKRLDVDPKDGSTVRVLDKDGKPSALTVDDLTKEFVDNPEFKPIVIASQASGSAVKASGRATTTQPNFANNGANTNGYTPPVNAQGAPLKLHEMSPQQMVEHRRAEKAAAEAEAGA